MLRPAALLLAALVAGGCGAAADPEPVSATASSVALPSPSTSAGSPSTGDTPSTTPTAVPEDTTTPTPTDPPTDGESADLPRPPTLSAFEGVDVPRIVVEHEGWYWVRLDGGDWRAVAPVEETFVIGDGRWLVDWQAPDPSLRSLDDPGVTCAPPDGFLDVEREWAVIHEAGVTSVFVEQADGSIPSVVCEDPGLEPPVAWSPGEDLGDGEYGPYTLVDDGVTLVLRGDAEGNVTVLDETGTVELIPYAISGPYADSSRGILVHVAQEGGMHFAGGTLVVTDLDGDEQRRVDLGGTGTLVGLLDGIAVVQRVDVVDDFRTTGHVLVDVDTGSIVADVPTDVAITYVGD